MKDSVSRIQQEVAAQGYAIRCWTEVYSLELAKMANLDVGLRLTELGERAGGLFVLYTPKDMDTSDLEALIAQKREVLTKL